MGSENLTVRCPILSFKDAVDAMSRLDLLAKKGNVVICKDGCVKCVCSLPGA